MRIFRYLAISLLLAFFSCKSEEKKKVTYFEGTEVIESIKIYSNQEELEKDNNYHYFNYFETGVLKEKFSIIDKKKHGTSFKYYKNGSIEEVATYNYGELNGVSLYYNEEGLILDERLYFDNKLLLLKKYTFFEKLEKNGYSIYLANDDNTMKNEGFIVFNEEGEVIDTLSSYYNVSGQDTVELLSETTYHINIFDDTYSNLKCRLIQEDIDGNQNFVDTTTDKQLISSSKDSIKLTISFNEKGVNLILGKLILDKDIVIDGVTRTVTRDYLLYKQVYVK